MKSIRLDKFLADSQLGTRSEVRQLLKKGLVSVNGEMVKKPEFKIDPASDRVCFDGKEVSSQQEVYYMLNKPAGVVSATRDNHDRTVLDLLPPGDRRPDLFPVGRLDKDTTGLLLITNDGALSHRLLSPRRHVDKTYFVRVNGRIREETVEAFRKGIDIGDEKITLPAELKPLGEDQALVTIREGRFHQIKRMFHAAGCEVTGLKRLTMGSLVLDENLPEGSFRRLTEEELFRLRQE
ncbi:MAG: 16S rRNA pseudouridine(516) synthase [Lachnospiraceae bacterium]|nr:16S rRNA pseudouridine(516) synthase [Lachnospiraceae bacterium]